MDRTFIIALLENLERLIALSAVSQVINILNEKRPKLEIYVRGVTFGLMGILIMLYPFTLEPGITFDSRSVLLSLTAALYPLPTSIILTLTLLAMRVYMGGAGVYMGVMVIITSSVLGYVWKYHPFIAKYRGSTVYYFSLGFIDHVFMLFYMNLLPVAVIQSTIIRVGIPVLITYPFVTIIIGKLLSMQIIQREQKLQIIQGEQKIRRIYDHAPVGIVNLSIDTRFISMNQVFMDLSGYDDMTLKGLKFSNLIIPETPNEEKAIIEQMKTGKLELFSADRQFRKYDASIIWVAFTVSKLPKEEPDGTLFIATIQDVTRRKESEMLNDFLVYHDQLTGAYNLKYLEEKEIEWQSTGVYPRYFFCIDLNNLRIINNAFGFKVGDDLLKRVHQAIFKYTYNYGKLIRFKSSELLLYVFENDQLTPEVIKQDIYTSLEDLSIENIEVSVAVGYSIMEDNSKRLSDVIFQAEENMRKDKLLTNDRSIANTIDVIMQSMFAKNSREMMHSQRVSAICVDIAKQLQLDKYSIEKTRIAGLMHDIGKIGIPETILDKPGALTQEEREKIQEHSIIGYRILSSTNEFVEISDIILSHHERWDGKGYPRGLSKESIPLFARIISVADTFDAMTSERTYRRPFSHKEAVDEIERMAGTQFDPEVVLAFSAVLKQNAPSIFTHDL